MPERDGYELGVPCWVDTGRTDPEPAVSFYKDLFGWEAEDQMPPDAEGRYFMCTLRGSNVAAVGSQPAEMAPPVPVWNTHIWVDSADDATAKARAAGGNVIMEPFDVLDAGRMAVLTDQAGASFCVWQANDAKGAQLVNEPGAWCWSELNTRDLEGAKAFYGAVFGWETEAMDPEYTLWRLPGLEDPIGGVLPMSADRWPEDVPPHWGIAFAVDGADATADRAEELGGKVMAPPFDTPVGRIAVLSDPQGAGFAVIKLSATS